MMETRIYNVCMLGGIVVLLSGIVFHSWHTVALGALVAGAGGLFGVFSTAGHGKD